MTKQYLSNLFSTFQKGDAREESYYEHLSCLIKTFSDLQRKKKIDVTILPKKTEAGNPDFRIWDGSQKIIGYIEAKDLGTDLDKIEDSEQIKRYLATFPNVILSNFTEFRLYREGELIEKVSIVKRFILKNGEQPFTPTALIENEDKLFQLLERFLDFSLPKTYTAKSLATELAKRTKFLKDEIVAEELKSGTKSIIGFFEAFQVFLIAGINEKEFADLYSQTITYGLFAARVRAPGEFNRKLAYSYIPKSIGILRDIFRFISLEDLPLQMEIIIDDIAEVLAVSDAKKILDQYYHEGKGSDPILHFYETFLSVYDPSTREKRGVYYTPEPVVSFIVRSLHLILKEKFNIPEGLAAEEVTLLDPAGGTLGFLTKAIEVAVEEFQGRYGKGAVKTFLKDRILRNYYSFELMMAPYAIGHMKMSFLLEELGYTMGDTERVKYYLTNTLEMDVLEESRFPGMSSLSNESREATKVKNDVPILVVLGNPPYSGHSSNKGKWISEEIKEYFQVDGKPLGERNSKWLQDDYVKFIRFSQWKIDQAGEGVLGFITNHSYLDNPTFRGMRQSLMKSFDEIYILDLHGNSLKKEKAPDGSKDENVFDIQQGVAVAFFIKHRKGKTKSILHGELFGMRETKYEWLNKHHIDNVKWNKLKPKKDFYLFIPQDAKHQKSYQSFEKITEIFPVNTVGIVTSRDAFVIDIDKKSLEKRIEQFVDDKLEDNIIKRTYDLSENTDWKIKDKRNRLRKDENWQEKFTRILYRPFDVQWIFYHDDMIERSRKDVMRHMLEKNFGIITRRQMLSNQLCNYVFICDKMICDGVIRSDNKGGESIFPLYIYPDTDKHDLFGVRKPGEKKPNINPELFEELKKNFKKEATPEEIFYYVYAVLYSTIYRAKYSEFLKIDFPRVPFTKNHDLFIKLGRLGRQLADLHLLKSTELEKPAAKYPAGGNNKVEKLNYIDKKVWINKEQYFDGIKEEVWKYQIGGYQVCEKWLKDRKGRTLSLEEIQTYCKIVTSLGKTITLQNEIDIFYNEVEEMTAFTSIKQ